MLQTGEIFLTSVFIQKYKLKLSHNKNWLKWQSTVSGGSAQHTGPAHGTHTHCQTHTKSSLVRTLINHLTASMWGPRPSAPHLSTNRHMSWFIQVKLNWTAEQLKLRWRPWEVVESSGKTNLVDFCVKASTSTLEVNRSKTLMIRLMKVVFGLWSAAPWCVC